MASLLPGSYVSRDAPGSRTFRIAAVPKSRLADGAAVFYAEAATAARPGAPFLQRFLRLTEAGGRLVLSAYEPRDLAGVRGKWREPESLALFGPRDVRERTDCRMTLEKKPAGHWAGGTAGATCFSAAANAPLAVTVSLSPQTLEWREEGKEPSGKTVYGPAGEITIYAREPAEAPAQGAGAPGAAANATAIPAASASAPPVAGGASRDYGISSKVNEPAAQAPAVLEVLGPSSPSKKYSLADLRGIASAEGVSIRRFFEGAPQDPATVVVVTSRNGAVSVFSSAEIFSSSSPSPSLDVSGVAPRLAAAEGRGLDDVASVELRVLGGR